MAKRTKNVNLYGYVEVIKYLFENNINNNLAELVKENPDSYRALYLQNVIRELQEVLERQQVIRDEAEQLRMKGDDEIRQFTERLARGIIRNYNQDDML